MDNDTLSGFPIFSLNPDTPLEVKRWLQSSSLPKEDRFRVDLELGGIKHGGLIYGKYKNTKRSKNDKSGSG